MRFRTVLATAALTAATVLGGASAAADDDDGLGGLMGIGNSAACGTGIPLTDPMCQANQGSHTFGN
ncbi:hypothetical protein DMA15_36075 [Streptomyces sp. WAC 01529]|uniref:hypothetical protein n=1 Tax=Streptomyces sp. WAC 01529 TaxID=2203205 RepID=UPI000F707DA4|nr:hypothetical protein [Streptomyces sp. WAC 01529]AZM57310.1 hypothetical protein DMA15_36075 [Streptomyces sp. WAC 01529]